MTTIKNIVLDYGGVIINLNYEATAIAFKELGVTQFEEKFSQWKQLPVFDLLDKGKIEPEFFISQIKKALNLFCNDIEIVEAWNKMLLDIPVERIELLKKLKSNYPLFLLSNTNEIHLKAIGKYLVSTYGVDDISVFFNKAFYSCRCAMRKPDAEFYELVLNENGLKATETLFVDDTIQNIEAAKKLGFQTILLRKEEELEAALKSFKIIC